MRIDPKVVDPDDVETLQDLVVGALQDASRAAQELQAEKMGPLAGGLGGGLGLPGLAGHGVGCVFEGPVQDLIDELGRLPGVGPKSAQRIAFHLLAADPADVSRLQDVLQKVKQGVQFCEVCGNVSERERCRYCADARRDPTLVCVVEEPKDVLAVERTREFKGRYHVLGGALDPLAGVGPDALRIRELLARLGGTGPADGRDRHRRGHHRDRPEHRGRGDRDLPGAAAARLPGPVGHPAGVAACRWAATWSSPTS